MSSIPKNNLKERMLKLGYKPDLVRIVPPVLDNSRVVIKKEEPKTSQGPSNPIVNFQPPQILNINDWSDFEDED